jgi:MarR family transcriptional regulator, temperature-dependent positive regulator of motility
MMEEIDTIRAFAILNRTYRNHFAGAMEAGGISYSEGIFLVNIGHNPAISQNELARDLVFDRAIVARFITLLEEKGYVQSERTNATRRGARLFLTESGDELFRSIRGMNRRWVTEVMSDIAKRDLPRISAALERMVARARALGSDPV